MPVIYWKFITKNQNKLEKAEKIAKNILEILQTNDFLKTSIKTISKYYKYSNSYIIELISKITEDVSIEKVHFWALELSSSLCSPWVVDFQNKGKNTNLLFTTDLYNHSFKKTIFNTIHWANMLIEI